MLQYYGRNNVIRSAINRLMVGIIISVINYKLGYQKQIKLECKL